jgi:hypothetical protein
MGASTAERTTNGRGTTQRTAPEPAREDERQERPPRWELAECTCPDFCERDHELD